jgi:hypothetical protein
MGLLDRVYNGLMMDTESTTVAGLFCTVLPIWTLGGLCLQSKGHAGHFFRPNNQTAPGLSCTVMARRSRQTWAATTHDAIAKHPLIISGNVFATTGPPTNLPRAGLLGYGSVQ